MPVWIGYTQARTILSQLDYLLEYPAMHRMPNLLIVGRTNNGKTMLIDRFLELRQQARRTADSRFDVVELLGSIPTFVSPAAK